MYKQSLKASNPKYCQNEIRLPLTIHPFCIKMMYVSLALNQDIWSNLMGASPVAEV